MTRRTGHEGLHTRVVEDKRGAEMLRQDEAEMREARLERLRARVAEMKARYRMQLEADPDAWYAAEVERMRERAPA